MKKMIVALLVTLLMSLSSIACAGERQGAISISPYIGGYTFDGVQQLETAPEFGLRLGYDLTKNWGIEAAGAYLATTATQSDRSSNAINYHLDLLYNFMPDGPLVPYLAAGGGAITAGHGYKYQPMPSNTDGTFNVGGGVKYFLTDSIAVRGDVRQVFDFGDKTVLNWEYSAGLTFLFCGKKPTPPPAPTSNFSASPASITKCDSATLSWTSQNTTNCDIQPNIGSVPSQGSMTVKPAADTTYTLTCSGPGGTTSSSANVVVAPPVPVKYCTTLKIEFETDKADIKPEFNSEIAKVAEFMKKYPTTTAVIEGHTDNVGTAEYNIKLSQQRADSVVKVLNEKFGIEAARLSAKGYGFSQPIADNATPEGRQKNRRIEALVDCAILVCDKDATPPLPPKVCIPLMIEFDFDKADIKPKYNQTIKNVADFMTTYPATTAVIEGHTDNVGTAEYNLKLSQQRAESVVRYLNEKFGIAMSRLTAKGYGFSQPIADNATPEGRQKNRRINAMIDCIYQK